MELTSEMNFHITVKTNLRTFLKTVGFEITEEGEFLTGNGTTNRMQFANKLAKRIEETENIVEEKYSATSLYRKMSRFFKNCDIEPEGKEDKPDKTLNAYLTYHICELFNFPIEKIICRREISLKEAEEVMANVRAEKYFGESVTPLTKKHSAYFGTFHGCILTNNPKKENFNRFELTIEQNEDESVSARYTYFGRSSTDVYHGRPYYSDTNDTIMIEMLEEKRGIYQYLYFYGRNYNEGIKARYKKGICVKTSIIKELSVDPEVKSFIFTRERLSDSELERYVIPQLKMTGSSFYVTKSVLDKLKAEAPAVDQFCSEQCNSLHIIDDAVYLINEQKILDSLKHATESESINSYACLCEIKKYALAPYRICYPTIDCGFDFFNNLNSQNEDNTISL